MKTITATNCKDAEEMLHSGIRHVELACDIDHDDFFRIASYWCDRGAKIAKKNSHFIISLKGFLIPPNE
ncbi:hypothetical protein [Erwinia psidii]|uniref:Uncharacterized protein n=1 Tax=Erwinia psidii TaxID=69224 RepID=A0A3N6S4P6_9GAMM|nr:hypothetical protein [Erwinia psidii]MCX8956551.1 hypothetical protein [Erwinia psidii]MCX8961539.1 hypothetical protein [Erwinia psidii]MCX8964993.1 hypothetical protein [Erwinia psidii]RQM39887.1 hypothetical protein EB241_00815 [Erwinia psidii]